MNGFEKELDLKLKKFNQKRRNLVNSNYKIQKIAKHLNINYTTAKTIIYYHKKKEINLDEQSESKWVSYKEIKNNNTNDMFNLKKKKNNKSVQVS